LEEEDAAAVDLARSTVFKLTVSLDLADDDVVEAASVTVKLCTAQSVGDPGS